MASITHSTCMVLKPGLDEMDIEAEIDNLTDFVAAIKLGEKFQPKVSMKGILEFEKAQQRLGLALQKVRGHMKNHSAMEDALTGMRQGDHASRIKLGELIEKLQGHLKRIDDILVKQFKIEEATRSALSESEKHKQELKNEKSIIVVAGEVSSGKSTLLNLILGGEKILPATRLSCTFTACKIEYGTTKKACIFYDDDRPPKEILFEEREKNIYKPTSRDKPFDHSGVHLTLPFSMLQSGITLVDTPGVGEHSTTEQIVLDYVNRNEVFGFIFTINAFDSGGVRLKFRELLHKLSEINDASGRPKLSPSSVICVVNFWDKVPEDEKQEIREAIEYYLKKMPFMGTFDPKEQIFFMDSQGAMESLNLEAKLITDDFKRLIDGIRKFFPVAQKLKLADSYLWMQNLLERLIHPVKTFLVKQRPADHTMEISGEIKEIQSEYKEIISAAQEKYKHAVSKLSNELSESLLEQTKKVLTWKKEEIPSQKPEESWTAYEERLDKAIDDRISQVILDIEEEHKFISKTYEDLVNDVSVLINYIRNKLRHIERALRNNVGKGRRRRSITLIRNRSTNRSIEVTVGQVHGAELIASKFIGRNMFERWIYGPTLAIFGTAQLQRRQAIAQEMEKFNSNPTQFVTIRAEVIYKYFCKKENINAIAQKELKQVEEFITKNEATIPEEIKSNQALLEFNTEIATQAKPRDAKYRIFLEEIQTLYDELLLLGRKSIVTDTFNQDAIIPNVRPRKFIDASVPQHFSNARLNSSENVTLMEFNTSTSCVLRFRETDIYNLQENLRNGMAREKAPKFLGTYNSGQTFVLARQLMTARCFTGDTVKWQGQIKAIMTLLGDLGRALNEIHLRKMAHCILSLDTLLLDANKDFAVRLTNLFELATIQINESEDLQTGQLLYLAPEILFGDQKLYTTAADVYALGLIMIELWYCHDVYHELKKMNFNQFKTQYKCDTGKCLLEKAEQIMEGVEKYNEKTTSIAMPKQYKSLVIRCLHGDERRLNMETWTADWDNYKDGILDEAKQFS